MRPGGMYIRDKIQVARLTATGIPEGRAIVFVEMLHQVGRREKTLKEAAAILTEVGWPPEQARALMAVFKAIVEDRGGKVAEHDFQAERCVFTDSWSAPAVPSPIARRRGFFVVEKPKGSAQ